jgi:hypothetical protein
MFYSHFTFPPRDLSFILMLLSHSLKVVEDPVCLLCASTGCLSRQETAGPRCVWLPLLINTNNPNPQSTTTITTKTSLLHWLLQCDFRKSTYNALSSSYSQKYLLMNLDFLVLHPCLFMKWWIILKAKPTLLDPTIYFYLLHHQLSLA